jgi:SulP family sulfate permease
LARPMLTLAVRGAIESLLCPRVADQTSGLPPHDPNQELMALGVGLVLAWGLSLRRGAADKPSA